MRIGIVGGTGREGRGLAIRWARAGHTVSVGSRDAARAKEAAALLSQDAGVTIHGGDNAAIVSDAEVVLLSVPYGAHEATLQGLTTALAGKTLIDITVPLAPPKVREVSLPPGKSAALEAQAILGAGTRVVATLHHVSSVHLADLAHVVDCDVLVCGDDVPAREAVMGLVKDLGLRPIDAGPLKNAIALEALTPVLLYINKKYASPQGSGIRITGI